MAKLEIKPVFVILSCAIIVQPFRHVWNNFPSSLAGHAGLVVFALIAGFVIIGVVLAWVLTACWKALKPN